MEILWNTKRVYFPIVSCNNGLCTIGVLTAQWWIVLHLEPYCIFAYIHDLSTECIDFVLEFPLSEFYIDVYM